MERGESGSGRLLRPLVICLSEKLVGGRRRSGVTSGGRTGVDTSRETYIYCLNRRTVRTLLRSMEVRSQPLCVAALGTIQ